MSRPRRPHPLAVEALEPRACPSLAVLIDYSRDAAGFFADPVRRDLLQLAADTIASRLGDSLAALIPVGADRWTAQFEDPATGLTVGVDNLAIAANTILIYAGGRPMTSLELGQGGPGGFSAQGSQAWLDTVAARGQTGALGAHPTDFGPWGGAIAFDTRTSWSFSIDPPNPTGGRNDFLSVALHEMSHLLGFGTAGSWFEQVALGRFTGAKSLAASDTGAPPILSPDLGHWIDGTTDGGAETEMDPILPTGARKLMTPLDFAGLGDVGWDVTAPPTGSLATADDPGFAALLGLTRSAHLAGSLASGTDVDLARFTAEAGATATFRVAASGFTPYLRVFDASGRELAASASGTITFAPGANGAYYFGVSGPLNRGYSPVDPLAGLIGGPGGAYDLTFASDGGADGTDVTAPADVALTASGPSSVSVGGTIEYAITVANRGPGAAGAVTVALALPAGTTFLDAALSQGFPALTGSDLALAFRSLPAGASATARVSIRVDAARDVGLALSARGVQPDPDPSNNVANVATRVLASGPAGDTAPPTVASVRVTTSGRGAKRSFAVVVTFSEAIDAGTAAALGNYRLTKAGPRRKGRLSRVAVGIKAATFDGSTIVTLTPAARGKLPRALQLRIAADAPAAIRDTTGSRLDGDRDGHAGGDAIVALG